MRIFPLFREWNRWLLIATLLGGCVASAHAAGGQAEEATQRYLATLAGDERARSDAYFEGGYWLVVWDLVVALGLAWLLLARGWSARLRALAERVTRRTWVQFLVYGALYLLAMALLGLPWTFYESYVREHQYHLSNLSPAGWFGEQVKEFLISLILVAPLLAFLLKALQKWPRAWWRLAAAATPAILILLLLITPVFIEPLFNTYRPLEEGPLKQSLVSLARANGVPSDEIVQFDASRQTDRISANVSGAFGTVRIALNDNLLKKCTPAEVKAVVAHELGHYVLNHTYKLTVYLSLVIAAGLAFTATVVHRVATSARAVRWGLRGPTDPACLPLYAAALAIFMTVATPVSNSIIRTTETEADAFGLNAAREPDGFATVALKVANYRKLAPGPWEEMVFFDHPSGYRRILMAMKWKTEQPTATGETGAH